ncbi:non-ribosomal peptide synthetase [Chitinophaga nivalis]|uniref:Amino acid adenylation domain-containing protein n=1 Tax=Chitinophaga nivalis TaxID=2991709 RepID=A0ABT3IGW7_9BACT|nr:non-ribosomal peptide synthetase [Chitinophaga nivalis]MCW3467115.1 amino acid adenylation domain-containing protein [Chitinophaga nivalis]MCW3483194.1 amino acid adenylation domain-containing protein [Chitinophaga nivalis]
MSHRAVPLHPAQQEVYVDQLINPDVVYYNIGGYIQLVGKLDKEKLLEAVRSLPQIFDVLKMRFDLSDPVPTGYVVDDYTEMELPELDFHAKGMSREACDQWVTEQLATPFTFDKSKLLIDQYLIKISEEEHWFYQKTHHLVSDGFGTSALNQYVAQRYKALMANTELNIKLPSYLEEAVRTSDYNQTPAYEAEGAYWKEKLGTKPSPVLQRKARSLDQSRNQFDNLVLEIDGAERKLLDALQERTKGNLQQLTIAAFIIYFAKTTEHTDFVFGIPLHKRRTKHLRMIAGMFTGIIPFKGEYDPEMKLVDLVRRIATSQREDYRYQNYMLADLSRHFKINTAEEQLIEILVNYAPLNFELDFGEGLKARTYNIPNGAAPVPLELLWYDYGELQPMEMRIDFREDYFTKDEIRLWAQRILYILHQFLENPEQSLQEIKIVPEAEQSLINTFHHCAAGYPEAATITSLIDAQVRQTPDAVAVTSEGVQLTYKQLDEKANQLAHLLISTGVTKEQLVPVCVERNEWMIIGILGILKAGAAYVPIDPAYPEERIYYMLEDTAAAVIVSSSACAGIFEKTTAQLVIMDDAAATEKLPVTPVAIARLPHQVAYVIFTSGSTGKPKGVLVEDRNVVRLFETDKPLYDFNRQDVWTMFHSFCFDFSVWEMYGALFYGGRLVIVPKQVTQDTELFAELLITEKVTVLNQTPSSFYVLQDYMTGRTTTTAIRYVIFGGEALNPAKLKPWQQQYKNSRLINMYGITETTVHVTYQELDETHVGSSASVIGKPIPTLSAYILDENLVHLPIGTTGELFIGGAGVARGYLNRPELTSERFIASPFEAGERLYRTGDLGRWLTDGTIEYLGRIDDQVKIRGFRIELGEIENVLQQSGLVQQGVVLAKADYSGNKNLVAYVVPTDDFTKEAAKNWLKTHLPDYMVPALWVIMDEIPLTANGKVNRKALPEPDAGELVTTVYEAPRNETEEKLAAIWQELLGITRTGIHDNFFELGGDSIRVITVVSRIRHQFKKEISVFEVYVANTIALLAELIDSRGAAAGEQQRKIYREIKAEIAGIAADVLPLLPDADSIEAVYPMSDIEHGMVYISLLNPEAALYHDQIVVRLPLKFDAALVKQAMQIIVEKHATLRTAFALDVAQHNLHIVYRSVAVAVDYFDIRHASEKAAKGIVEAYLQEERARPFDITKAPLWRTALFGWQDYQVFVLQVHHAVLDGWSVASLHAELYQLCTQLQAATTVSWTPLKCSYEDYIIETLAAKQDDENKTFWKQDLDDYKRLNIFSTEDDYQVFDHPYEAAFLEKLKIKTKQDNLTLKGLFLGACAYALGMLTYEEEVTIGLVTNNRPVMEDSDKLLGCFLNTIPFRFETGKQHGTWKNYFEKIEEKLLQMKRREKTSLFEITKITKEQTGDENPYFDVIFNFVNFHVYEEGVADISPFMNTAAISDGTFINDFTVTNTWLDFSASITNDVFILHCVLRKKFRSGKTLQDLQLYFDQIIHAYLDEYEGRLVDSVILPSAEQLRLLQESAGPAVDYPADRTAVAVFEERALITPGAVAVRCEDKILTYAELDAASNQLAHYLRRLGVEQDTLIPLCIERSADMLVAILGIWKAGGAYAPIDVTYPEERISYIVGDCEAQIVICTAATKANIPAVTHLVVLDEDRKEIAHAPVKALQTQPSPDDLAYVIYTSGSTGKPKGVMVEHKGMLNHLYAKINDLQMNHHTVQAYTASYTFDISVWQMFSALLVGGETIVFTDQLIFQPAVLMDAVEQHQVSILELVPSYLASVLQEEISIPLPRLQYLMVTGEVISQHVLAQWFAHPVYGHIPVVNAYGPTEASDDITHYFMYETPDTSNVPLGKTIQNLYIYILDKSLQLAPAGVAGEICVAGIGVSRGYLKRPELTADRFIRNPFSTDPGSRMYRTGDLGRWLPDGNIEYLGRIDEQVKIRGYRIELGEIETAVRQSGLVHQGVVMARPDENGNKRLVGYVVPTEDFDREGIRHYLKDKLPEYMVPTLWVILEEMPLTPNGKIDRKALPEPAVAELIDVAYVAPRNEAEQVLADIWQTLLRIERVGINDNFFGLGGDSIITIQVVSRAKRLGYELQAREIFQYQTIAQLAAVIALRKGAVAAAGEQGTLEGAVGLLPIQQAFFEAAAHMPAVPQHYNQTLLFSLDKRVTAGDLSGILMQLQRQHDALRMEYRQDAGKWIQTYGNRYTELETADLSAVAPDELSAQITACCRTYQASLDISSGALIRMVHIQTPAADSHHRLLIVIHHLATDGVSWRILLEDLERLLTARAKGTVAAAEAKSWSYRQWYTQLETYSRSRRLLTQQRYWENVTAAATTLPVDKATTTVVRKKDTAAYNSRLDATATRLLLQEVPAAYHTEINDILLAALAQTLSAYSGHTSVVIGMEGHGREAISREADISRTVGWFTSLFPVWLNTENVHTSGDLIKSIKEQLRNIPDKGLGYGVLKYIHQLPSLAGQQPWEIEFNYLGQLDNITAQSEWLETAAEYAGEDVQEDWIVAEKLAINSRIQEGVLQVEWTYSGLHFEETTIATLAEAYLQQLTTLITHSVEQAGKAAIFTPSDYGLETAVSYQQLDAFLYGSNQLSAQLSAVYRLSGLQEGMLFHGLYDAHGGAYVEQLICEVSNLDIPVFRESWAKVLQQHSILRSSFNYEALSVPVQCVHHHVTLPFETADYRHLSAADQEVAIQALMKADRNRGFDYAAPPLMRITLMQTSDTTYRMLWTFHHLLLDGWSVPVLFEELFGYYENILAGKPVVTGTEDLYQDYIRYIENRDSEAEENYWRGYMQGTTAGTLLPYVPVAADRTRSAGEYLLKSFTLDAATTSAIQAYAQQNKLTVNTIMQGVWTWILQQYTGQDAVTFGVTVSGRNGALPGVEQRVGLYINTLPLHVQVDRNMAVIPWLETIQQREMQSREYEYTPINTIQRWLGLSGDLFDSIMVYENYPVSEAVKAKGWSVQIDQVKVQEQTNYPLSILIAAAQEIYVQFGYNTALLEEVYVAQLAEHFRTVLLQIVSGAKHKLADITLLTATEYDRLVNTFNETDMEPVTDTTIPALFEVQAARTPMATAVVFEDKVLTYQELNDQANRLSYYLTDKGLNPGDLVPVCIDRSPEMMIALLGILKAGGVYVPIDPSYPADRISYMLENSGRENRIVATTAYRAMLTEISPERTVVCIDELLTAATPARSWDNPITDITGSSLAYIIYTSGSTGKPKGVTIEHAAVINLIRYQTRKFGITAEERILQFSSYAFDAAVEQMYLALFNGAALVLIPDRIRLDKPAFEQLLQQQQVTHLHATPGFLQTITPGGYSALKRVIAGGEACSIQLAKEWGQYAVFYNEYGPTETTVTATEYLYTATAAGKQDILPIGKPLGNTRAYVLDAFGNPQPIGIAGELYIGGKQVSPGYLHLPELTKEKFVTDHFTKDPAAKLYKTGDLCRWLPDGNLEFLGRIDDQVKVRGYRIELGEIVHVLEASPLVKQAVVLALPGGAGADAPLRLVAYVVPEGAFDKEGMVAWLQRALPDYMIPALLIELDHLPLTANGKIDRKALPDPVEAVTNVYVAPRNETELTLARIWQTLLETEQIGVHDNFFERGGHSLLAIRLMAAVRKELSAELVMKDIFNYPSIAALTDYLQEKGQTALLPAITPVVPKPQHIPLSFSQERLWFIDELEGSLHYHIPAILKLSGPLDQYALKAALQEIINRHEVLRTVILHAEEFEMAHQQLLPENTWQLETISTEDTAAAIREFIDRPFILAATHMLRAGLIQVAATEHLLVLTIHHIASDGWSVGVILRELSVLYNAYAQDRTPVLPALPVQYADYALWQRAYVTGEVLTQQKDYWIRHLAGLEPLQLPTDFPRPAIQSTRGAAIRVPLPAHLAGELQQLSQHLGSTLFMTLFSAFQVLLYRYSGQEDICVGTPVAGRRQQEVEGLIGFFVNTLALRSQLQGDMSFTALLQQVRTNLLDAYSHQDIPFEKIVDVVAKDRDMSRLPVFQVMFVLQEAAAHAALQLDGITVELEEVEHTTAKFDLIFELEEGADSLALRVEYCRDLFREETIRQMIGHYAQLLEAIVTAPQQQIGLLPMLAPAEEHRLLQVLSGAPAGYPEDKTITDLFEAQVQQTPDAIAVVYEHEQLTYRRLDELAVQLGHYLRHKGVVPGMLVPVCLNRSVEMIVGIMGILKAGAAYVPIDPVYPEDRIRYMVEDTASPVIVTSAVCAALFEGMEKAGELVLLDADAPQISKMPQEAVPVTRSPKEVAYVIYTSGSTGRPKGVLVTHENVVRLFETDAPLYDFDEQDVWTMFHSFCFDFSVWEMYGALFYGGKLIVVPRHVTQDAVLFGELLIRERVTVLNQTPSSFYVLQDYLTERTATLPVRYVIFGGEALNPGKLKPWKQLYKDCRLINMYGITETTVHVTFQELDWHHLQQSASVIGKPIPTLRAYILNAQQGLVPVGVAGELYVGGAGVAKGYLNLPGLTTERFIMNPFSPEERLYRTGDLGRWLQDGNIEYLGRIDDQVKIRGFRIELGEIENVLQQSGLVNQGVVLAKTDQSGNKRLVGYVVPAAGFSRDAVMAALKERLPDYMVPALWVTLEEIPLTSNGKVNRKALPDPDAGELSDTTYVAPRNETEEDLADIYEQLLSVSRVGIHDNFFGLGGDSIITIQVVSRAKRLGYEVQAKDVFMHQTIAQLAAVLQTRKGKGDAVVGEQGILSGTSGLLPIQQWFFEEAQSAAAIQDHFNQSVLLAVDKNVDETILAGVLQQLQTHHDALRFTYHHQENSWQQEYGAHYSTLEVTDLTGENEHTLTEAITRCCQYHQGNLDIRHGDLIRMVLIRTPDHELQHRLLLVIHHLAVDGVSWRILLEDTENLLQAAMKGAPADLGLKSTAYRQWYDQLVTYSQSRRLLSQQRYWESVNNTTAHLPVDVTFDHPVCVKDNGQYISQLDAVYTQRLLQEVPRAYHTEINDILLAALTRTLTDWSNTEKVVIGLEGHGREEIGGAYDISRTVGWFTSLYPVQLRATKEEDAGNLIKSVKEQLRQIPDKGLGYGVLKYISKVPALQGAQPWEIVFNYLGQMDNVAKSNGRIGLAPESTGQEVHADYHTREKLSVNSMIQDGVLSLHWTFSRKHYDAATIARLADNYLQQLIALITHCVTQGEQEQVFTPSDYGLSATVSIEQLDQFLNGEANGNSTELEDILNF